MKKKILLSFLFCLFLNGVNLYAQKKETSKIRLPREITLRVNYYKEKFNIKQLSPEDSTNTFMRDGHRVIKISDQKKISEIIKNLPKSEGRIERSERTYISINTYRRRFKKEPTSEDAKNFKFHLNDTLVLIKQEEANNLRRGVPYEPVDSLFLETYKDVVFQKYYGSKETSSKIYMQYWKDEIKIHFTKGVSKEIQKKIKKVAKLINKNVDSLQISFVKKQEKSNFLIFTANSGQDIENEIKKKTTAGFYYWNGKQQLYKAYIRIVNTKATTPPINIEQIFFKTLGAFKSSYRLPKESILSTYTYDNKEITDIDLKLLKYHYSYGISKGTNLESFERSHKRAKEIFKKTGNHLRFVNE